MKMSLARPKLGLLLTLLLAVGSGLATAKSDRVVGALRPESTRCINHVLRSYQLKGRRTSTGRFKSMLCPTITQNCCNRFDEQRAYHWINDLLPNQLNQYREKVRGALWAVRLFRKKILDQKIVFRGNRARRNFCMREYRRLDGEAFNSFQEKLLQNLNETYTILDDHYNTFYCIICDGANHKTFVFRKSNHGILVDQRFCSTFLEENKELLEQININLVKTLMNMQNVVDCLHYRSEFSLPFFDQEKRKLFENTGKCLNALGSKDFMVNCKPICDKVTYTNVMSLFEGDFEFMTIAVNLFQRYLVMRESAPMVSDKLRSFFKSITKNDPNHPLSNGILDINFDNLQVGIDFDPQMNIKSNRALLPDLEPTENDEAEITKADDPQARFLKLNERQAHAPPARSKQPKKAIRPFTKRERKDRILAAVPSSRNKTKTTDSWERENPRKQPLVIAPELVNKYRMLMIKRDLENLENIYEVDQPPVDFDKAERFYDLDRGINTEKYKMNISIPERAFYLKLYSFRQPEKLNNKLNAFLSDFTPMLRIQGASYLRENYKIFPAHLKRLRANDNDEGYVESMYKKE